jgi:hypothetical protein
MARDRSGIVHKAVTAPVVPSFPGMADTPIGTAGRLASFARSDHTHPAQPASAVGVLTDNRLDIQRRFAHSFIPADSAFHVLDFSVGFGNPDDPTGGWDNTNNRWTVPATGWYLEVLTVGWPFAGVDYLEVKSATAMPGSSPMLTAPSEPDGIGLTWSFLVHRTAGSFIGPYSVNAGAGVAPNLFANLAIICLGTQ